jgi:hypothetical protein
MRIRCRILVPVLLAAVAAMPGAVTAQQVQSNPNFCGAVDNRMDVPGTTLLPRAQNEEEAKQDGMRETPVVPATNLPGLPAAQQPDIAKQEGLQELGAVRGSVMHAEGNLMLLRLPDAPALPGATAGPPPAPAWAVVRLPENCSVAEFPDGTAILAVGEATREGIFEATAVAVQPPA